MLLDFRHAFSKVELMRVKNWFPSGVLYITENNTDILGNVTCSQKALGRPCINLFYVLLANNQQSVSHNLPHYVPFYLQPQEFHAFNLKNHIQDSIVKMGFSNSQHRIVNISIHQCCFKCYKHSDGRPLNHFPTFPLVCKLGPVTLVCNSVSPSF